MAFPCPRCGDRYTQSLPMMYGTSTHVRSWRSLSGYRGSTTSQTLVGGLASPPVKRSVLWPLLWLLVSYGVFTAVRGFVQDERRTASAETESVQTSVPRVGSRVPPAGPSVPPVGRRMPARHHAGSMGMPPVRHQSALTATQWERVTAWVAVVGAGLGTLMVWLVVRAIRFNRWVYPREFHRWSQSFMCRGCGAVFAAPDSGLVALPPR